MSLWKIAWRSIQQRSLASTLTGVSMALGVMLVVAVMVVGNLIENYFKTGTGLGYNLVIGKKGGEYQLVLNTVYYLGRPIENIPWSYYKEFLPASKRSDRKDGKFAPWVDKAVPCNLGDYYGQFRVVGTTPDFFGTLEPTPGQSFQFTAGVNFTQDDYFSGVVGAVVAQQTGLRVGDKFKPSHAAADGHVHDEQFTVTGILERTGTPIDRALFINIEGFFLLRGHALEGDPTQPGGGRAHLHKDEIPGDRDGGTEDDRRAEETTSRSKTDSDHHDHKDEGNAQKQNIKKDNHKADHDPVDAPSTPHNHEHTGEDADHDHSHAHDEDEHDHHEPLPDEKREVTAVLVLTKSIAGLPPEATVGSIYKAINKDVVAQAVQPIRVIYEFLSTFLQPLQLVLLVLTILIVIVSAISILVSIYNSMSERRHEIAVMRALGAGRATVMRIMLLESILLALGGGLIGWLVGHLILGGITPWLTQWTGVTFTPFHFTGAELLLIPGIIALASLVGFLPAWSAYRTDVAKALTATP